MIIPWLSLFSPKTLFLSVPFGEDLVTLDGPTFRQVQLSRRDDNPLRIRHKRGDVALFFDDVAEPIRKRLGFDPDASLERLTLPECINSKENAMAQKCPSNPRRNLITLSTFFLHFNCSSHQLCSHS